MATEQRIIIKHTFIDRAADRITYSLFVDDVLLWRREVNLKDKRYARLVKEANREQEEVGARQLRSILGMSTPTR